MLRLTWSILHFLPLSYRMVTKLNMWIKDNSLKVQCTLHCVCIAMVDTMADDACENVGVCLSVHALWHGQVAHPRLVPTCTVVLRPSQKF